MRVDAISALEISVPYGSETETQECLMRYATELAQLP